MRRVVLIFALVAGAFVVPAVGAADADDTAAQKAAKEIAQAQAQANAAAQAWEDARAELDRLSDEEAQVEEEQAALQEQVDALNDTVHEVAINRFVAGSQKGIPLLNGLTGPTDQAQAEVLAEIANDSSAAQLNEWQVASHELAAKNDELQRAQQQTKAAQEQVAKRQAEAEALVAHLQEVEAQRLKDEAVRKELERIRAAEQAKAAAEQAKAAAEQQAAQQAAVVAAAVPQAAGPARGGGAEEATEAPATTAAPATSSGGGNGGGGSDSTQAAAPPPATTTTTTQAPSGGGSYTDSSMICPAPGSAFGDTWGAARSGGRKHEGVDMIGREGMPIYAVVSGSVQFKQTPLGGNSAWVTGNNGNRYFYAHLSGFEGSSRSVQQGELIAYMGHTGNANGVNHLHFEIHPGGGAAVNPYPGVRAVC